MLLFFNQIINCKKRYLTKVTGTSAPPFIELTIDIKRCIVAVCSLLPAESTRSHTQNFYGNIATLLKMQRSRPTPLTPPLHQLGTPKIFMFYTRKSLICDILYSGSNTMQEHQKVGIAASRAEECQSALDGERNALSIACFMLTGWPSLLKLLILSAWRRCMSKSRIWSVTCRLWE